MANLRFATPTETRIKNTFRVEVAEEKKEKISLEFFVKRIMFDLLHIKREEVLCLKDPGRGLFILTLNSTAACDKVFERVRDLGNEEDMQGLLFIALYSSGEVPVIITMHDPHVDLRDISLFLSQYCAEVKYSHKIMNSMQLWTGKHKFLVKFKEDITSVGGICRPPANFSIGRKRGYLFFPGMPYYCRKCQEYGHTQDSCKEDRSFCKRCGQKDHSTTDCKNEILCNVCKERGHTFKDCPNRSWAQRVMLQKAVDPPEVKSTENTDFVTIRPKTHVPAVEIIEPAVDVQAHKEAKTPGMVEGLGTEVEGPPSMKVESSKPPRGDDAAMELEQQRKRKTGEEEAEMGLQVKRSGRVSADESDSGRLRKRVTSASDPANIQEFVSIPSDWASASGSEG